MPSFAVAVAFALFCWGELIVDAALEDLACSANDALHVPRSAVNLRYVNNTSSKKKPIDKRSSKCL